MNLTQPCTMNSSIMPKLLRISENWSSAKSSVKMSANWFFMFTNRSSTKINWLTFLGKRVRLIEQFSQIVHNFSGFKKPPTLISLTFLHPFHRFTSKLIKSTIILQDLNNISKTHYFFSSKHLKTPFFFHYQLLFSFWRLTAF